MSRWQKWHEEIASGCGGALSSVVRSGLGLASHAYGAAVRWRNRSFDNGRREVRRVSVPVISIGNLTTGGTGKSPMVIELVYRLMKMGRKPAVVSRGYKPDATGESDEIMMMQRAIPDLLCVVNTDRVAGANAAIANDADVILLDDGFQHRRLARDLDLVLIDATRPFGFGHLLPRGLLREPIENANRADAIVLTRANEVTDHRRAELLRLIHKLVGETPVLSCMHRAGAIELMDESGSIPFDIGECQPVYLVSGIGNPDSFERTVRGREIEIAGHQKFADHHAYINAHVEMICESARTVGAKSIITTAKDAVKLNLLNATWTVPIFVSTVNIDFSDNDSERMRELLAQTVAIRKE